MVQPTQAPRFSVRWCFVVTRHLCRVQAVHTNRVVEALRATSQFGVLNETSLINMAVTG